MNLKLALIVSATLLTACASVNSVSLTPIPKDRSNPVKVEASKTIFLGFNFDNDFINNLVDGLKAQCPNGKVSGILTKDEDINYFLYIVWKKQITASGYCIKGGATASSKTKTKKREAASEIDRVSEESTL